MTTLRDQLDQIARLDERELAESMAWLSDDGKARVAAADKRAKKRRDRG